MPCGIITNFALLNIEKIVSQKHKGLLHKGLHISSWARINTDDSASWRCVNATCRGQVKVLIDNKAINITGHRHAPNPAKYEAVKSVAKMRKRAAAVVEKPRQMIQQSTNRITLKASVHLLSYTACQRTIKRVRSWSQFPYPKPITVADIENQN